MKLKNDFTIRTRSIYAFEKCCQYPKCWAKELKGNNNKDGCNTSLELHHILNRSSNSTLNSIMVCRMCHDKIQITLTKKEKSELLKQQLRWLVKIGYEFIEEDYEFYNKYIEYYE